MANDASDKSPIEPVDYERLAETFNQALLHTLRKHSIADSFLDYWVPDADPVLGITGMADSARIAGFTEITIRFLPTTIPEPRWLELEKSVGRFAKVSFGRDGDKVILRASNMMKTAADFTTGVAKASAKSNYWEASKITSSLPGKVKTSGWDNGDISEFGDVHPHFRTGMKNALVSLSHEGGAGTTPTGYVRVQGHEGTTSLTLDVDPKGHVVRAAKHAGAIKPSERVALDLFCRAAENLPFQEVADHVGLKVIDSLVDQDKSPPVGGVLLPINAGLPFLLPPRLARQAYDAYRGSMALGNETNFYYAPPSQQWQRLSSAERHEKILRVLRGFLQSEELYPDDIELIRFEKNKTGYEVRGVVSFSDRIEIDKKPFLMRRLEQRLRRDLESEIELVADRAKDTSPLRRLS